MFIVLSLTLVSWSQQCGTAPTSVPGPHRQTKSDATAGRWPFPAHNKQQFIISLHTHTHTYAHLHELPKVIKVTEIGGAWLWLGLCVIGSVCRCIYIMRSVFDQQRPFSHYHFNGINPSARAHTHKCCPEQTYCNNTVVWKYDRIGCVCVTSVFLRAGLPQPPPSV